MIFRPFRTLHTKFGPWAFTSRIYRQSGPQVYHGTSGHAAVMCPGIACHNNHKVAPQSSELFLQVVTATTASAYSYQTFGKTL